MRLTTYRPSYAVTDKSGLGCVSTQIERRAYEQFDEHAHKMGLSKSALMRKLIEEFLANAARRKT